MSYLHVFFNDTATTEIYTLSLHDALPISSAWPSTAVPRWPPPSAPTPSPTRPPAPADRPSTSPPPSPDRCGSTRPPRSPLRDRKSTRLNSSHANISYAVFCLKKKKGHTAG